MTQKISYYPLTGGLDITTPAIVAKPGTARAASNYEADMTGYRRMSGYERYDGQPSPTDAYDAAATVEAGVTARNAARALIAVVPGSGPVRGVWYYNGFLYAWRNNAGGTAGVMYRATPAGWLLISSAFPAGGTYEFVTHNFTGSTATVKMYGINGVGQGFQYDGTTVTFIATGMVPNVPTKVAAHKRHLFFSFAGGSVQHSSLGDPLTWTAVTGAAELAFGDEITDLIPSAPNNLAIMAKNSVSILYGNDASDWQIETLTAEAGVLPFTAEKLGPIVYMDNRGIRSLNTTPAFGNFTVGSMTQLMAPILRTKLASGALPVASLRVRARDMYRVFFADGFGLSVYLGRKVPEVMPIDLSVGITCAVSAETSDTTERIWFGADTGYVYEMDKGRSYDGAAIEYYLRLPFNHLGGPTVLKRWHKVTIEYDAAGQVDLRLAGEFDNADPNEPALSEQTITGFGGGGFWGSVNWDQFYWSAPVESNVSAYIDGVGRNLSLLIGGDTAEELPHILQGITIHYSVRGSVR